MNSQATSNSHAAQHRIAWACSTSLHLALLLALLLVVRQRAAGTLPETARNVSVAMVKIDGDERRFFDEGGELSDGNPAAPDVNAWLPTEEELAVDVSGQLPDVSGAGALPAGEVGLSSEAAATPGRDRFGESGSTITSVFGVRGEGARFVYVFDRSGSMGGFGGLPLRAAKHELLASLKDLQPHHQFQIVFYDDGVELFNPLGGRAQLVWADEAGRNLAAAFVQSIDPDGGTNHLQPLHLALNMRPDVIFLLTDADQPPMTSAQLKSVRRRNTGATIHAIQFGVGPPSSSQNFLSRLAAQNGGQYRYIDINRLPNHR
jgi:hypothetical protein